MTKKTRFTVCFIAAALAAGVLATPLHAAESAEEGFVSLCNGKNLEGWVGDTKGYVVEDGAIVCRPGGNLYTAKEYGDFVLRLEFKLTPGANNGVGIRTPLQGDAAYVGMEIQVLDDTSDQYKDLKPYQFHGSIYGLVPAQRGHLKPVGEWNVEEITAVGPKVKVVLNGTTIVDADLDRIQASPDIHDLNKHPGRNNKTGHIGFLGHGSVVSFRNVRIKEVGSVPPPGFVSLFNGRDLTGWKGLVGNPLTRAKMSPAELAEAQQKADADMKKHWRAEDGVLVFDGKGQSICTARDYRDFELLVDWKILPDGDSGIYLLGSPQVQIWDAAKHPEGSGGLFNNQKHPVTAQVAAPKRAAT